MADFLSPEACHRTLAVFDGRLRYDLQFAFKRMDKVKADKGYAGPVVVCAAYFSPVAGFVPSRAAIKYLSKQRGMEVWLAPVAGTRVLVPYRAQGPRRSGKRCSKLPNSFQPQTPLTAPRRNDFDFTARNVFFPC